MKQMKAILMLALAACFAFAPLYAEADEADSRPKLEKKAKKAKKSRKKDKAVTLEERDELKFKWHKSLKSALKEAKKYNTTCFVVYSDPKRCQACAKFEKEILNSPEFKKAKGVGVGFRSAAPLPQFGLNKSKPMTVVVDQDGKIVAGNMGYHKGLDLGMYLDRLKDAQPRMLPTPVEEDGDDE